MFKPKYSPAELKILKRAKKIREKLEGKKPIKKVVKKAPKKISKKVKVTKIKIPVEVRLPLAAKLMAKTNLLDADENVDVVISFDTTGSQYPCLTQVRRSIQDTVNSMFLTIPKLRIAIIAHGDYCDKNHPYITKTLNFTNNVNEICNFVNNVEPTGGGDSPECYELVLNICRKLDWKAEKSKALIMIGDDVPHSPSYPENKDHIDWENEAKLLNEMGVKIYATHCMPGCRSHSKWFYQKLACMTDGRYLTLDQFSETSDMIMLVCCKERGMNFLDLYANQLAHSGKLNRNLTSILLALSGKTYKVFDTKPGLIPVSSGRFQILDVDESDDGIMISDFVKEQGANFQKGRGFYEFTKREKIQGYKEIILMDKDSGDIYNGEDVRKILGLPPQSDQHDSDREDVKLRPADFDKYDVFVQSTSYNRKLVGGTRLLYEVEDWIK